MEHSTNNRTLRHDWIDSHFLLATFFVTSKSTKSTRGNTFCLLFVIDKSFVHAEPLRKRSDLICALNIFSKEVRDTEAIIADFMLEENSAEVKQFYSQVGASTRSLEKGIPWSNLDHKHIGLFKEAACKDLQATSSNMDLWDYCVERRS